jgi:hypothetical protein
MNWKHWKSPSLSKVIALELEITEAVLKGHKASHDDIYEEKRRELKRLREALEIPNHQQQKHSHSNFN